MRYQHPILIILLALFVTASSWAETIDGVAAIADGQVLNISDLRQRLQELKADSSKAKEVLDKMIEETLMDNEIRKRGLSATANEIDEAIKQILQQNGLRTIDQLAPLLKEQGLDETSFRQNLRKQIEQGKFVNFVMGAKIKIQDQDVSSYYQAHYVRNQDEPQWRLRTIFIAIPENDSVKNQAAKDKLKMVQRQLKQGVNFTTLAKKYGEGAFAADGGLMGDFRSAELDAAFVKAVQNLKVGQTSDVVYKKEGAYIFKLDDLVHGNPPALKEVEAEIMRKLQTQEIERLFRLWMRQARDKAFVDIRITDFSKI